MSDSETVYRSSYGPSMIDRMAERSRRAFRTGPLRCFLALNGRACASSDGWNKRTPEIAVTAQGRGLAIVQDSLATADVSEHGVGTLAGRPAEAIARALPSILVTPRPPQHFGRRRSGGRWDGCRRTAPWPPARPCLPLRRGRDGHQGHCATAKLLEAHDGREPVLRYPLFTAVQRTHCVAGSCAEVRAYPGHFVHN